MFLSDVIRAPGGGVDEGLAATRAGSPITRRGHPRVLVVSAIGMIAAYGQWTTIHCCDTNHRPVYLLDNSQAPLQS
jgi:hypothetical protein